MEYTREQLRSLPDWLRNFDNLAEDGATPITMRDWNKARKAYLGVVEPAKRAQIPLNIVTEELLREIHLSILELLQPEPSQPAKDRAAALGLVVEARLAAVIAYNNGKRQSMSKARAARQPGGNKAAFKITDPNGNQRTVYGYAEAAIVTGYKQGSIRTSVANAKRLTGVAKATLGLPARPENLWVVERITDPRVLHHTHIPPLRNLAR